MRWIFVLVALVTLLVMLLMTLSSDVVRAQEDVAVTPSSETPLEEETQTFGIAPLATEFLNGSAVAVGTGSLKSPTPITLKTFENRPEGGAPRSKAIGLRTVVELPFSQLDLSNPMTKSLFIYAPAFEGAYKSADHPVQEVTISLSDGKEYVFLDSYIPDFPGLLTPAILEVVTGVFSSRSGMLRVSVQPIDAGGVLGGSPGLDSSTP